MVDGQSGIPREGRESPTSQHARRRHGAAQAWCGSSSSCLCGVAFGGVGSPGTDRRGAGGGAEAGTGLGTPCPMGVPVPFLWQRFSEQRVLSKAILQ